MQSTNTISYLVVAPTNPKGAPDFSLIENNKVCLRASFESKIVIKYQPKDTSKVSWTDTYGHY